MSFIASAVTASSLQSSAPESASASSRPEIRPPLSPRLLSLAPRLEHVLREIERIEAEVSALKIACHGSIVTQARLSRVRSHLMLACLEMPDIAWVRRMSISAEYPTKEE